MVSRKTATPAIETMNGRRGIDEDFGRPSIDLHTQNLPETQFEKEDPRASGARQIVGNLAPKKPTRVAAKKLDARGHPPKAIRWRNSKQRKNWLEMWKRALMRVFDKQARALKLGWTIRDLAAGPGYCFAQNEYLSQVTGISVKRIDETLRLMERKGAILRVRASTRGGRMRRIYLNVDIIGNPPESDGLQNSEQSPCKGVIADVASNHPKGGQTDHPKVGGSEGKKAVATPSRPSNASVATDGGARPQARAPLADDGDAR